MSQQIGVSKITMAVLVMTCLLLSSLVLIELPHSAAHTYTK